MKTLTPLAACAVVLLLATCTGTEKKASYSNRQVEVDTLFTNKFLPHGTRFTGGDAAYSIELPDGQTLWIFGDTFIGNVTPENRRLNVTPTFIRNSFVIIQGDSLKTFQQGEPKEFKSMMIPSEVTAGTGYDEHDYWYWPGDAFLEGGNLNVFVSKFFLPEGAEEQWGFQFKGTELQEFSLPDLKPLRADRFEQTDSVHYGHAICETPEYTYIYGLKKQFPYVARAKAGEVRKSWKFFNGTDWSDKAEDGAPMLEFSGSEQFSVFEWKGTYVMIMQGGGFSRNIHSFTSATPFGPWGNQKMLYETPLPDSCKGCFTYNALGHPQFITDDLLLVSYNTNSMSFQDHYDNALIYRPRFIKVPMELILGQ